MALPTAPRGAGPGGRRLWRELLKVYVLGEHELAVLREAVHVVDLCAELQQLLDTEGLTDGKGRKRWEITELRMQRRLVAQLLATIRIPADVAEQAANGGPSTSRAGQDPAGQPPRAQHRGIRGVYPIKLAGGQDR